MSFDNITPNPSGRRLAGSALYALLVTAVALPVMIGIAGLVVGPQALREKVIITAGQFAAFHGRAGLFMVMVMTVVGLTLFNFVVGPRQRYAWNWGLGPKLMDDALSPREKLTVVLKSGWGRALLALDLYWIILTALTSIPVL